jgi:antitoxin VapB
VITKENNLKEERIRHYLQEKGFDFVLLTRRDNFAWLTCGGLNHIPLFTETGCVSLLIGAKGERFVLANRIEAPRLVEEHIKELEYEIKEFPWFEGNALRDEALKLTGSGKSASDVPMEGFADLPADFWKIRNPLLPEEVERYRKVGYDASEALLEAARSVGPGFKEFEIEAIIAASCHRRALRPAVILVAAEDRIDRFRHPLAKETPFFDRLMLVLCAERHGMIANLTRFLYSRSIPRKLDRLHEAVARVDAAAIAASRPGRTLGEVFQRLTEAYEKEGFKDEWHLHHQGGPTGYQGRDLIVTPECEEKILFGMALAWNPSITGTKSEDTVLVTEKGSEIITRGEGWEYLSFDGGEGAVERPWPLVI